jgi:integrase
VVRLERGPGHARPNPITWQKRRFNVHALDRQVSGHHLPAGQRVHRDDQPRLRRQGRERLAAGQRWRDHGLVFASQAGTPLDASHVRRAFKAITKKAGLGENWTPRELRHSFVSLRSDNGVPLETIADLVGHASTAVTEEVYRHQLKPVITRGAETMNTMFKQNAADSA